MAPDPRIIKLAQELAARDVEAGALVRRLTDAPPLEDETLGLIRKEAESGLAQELGFGRAYLQGMVLLASKTPDALSLYCRLASRAAARGATLGTAIARGLAPAIRDPRLRAGFQKAVRLMSRHGAHVLKLFTAEWLRLLDSGETGAAAGLALCSTKAFGRSLSYHQALLFSQIIPEASRKMPQKGRPHLLAVAARVAQADEKLLEPFFDGLFSGLSLLAEKDIEDFVDQALARLPESREAAARRLSLTSEAARQKVAALQTALPLSRVAESLARYLRARLGSGVPVLSRDEMPRVPGAAPPHQGLFCLSDGRALYLPAILDRFESQEKNRECAKILARLEAGLFECGTFAFDLEKAEILCQRAGISLPVETQAGSRHGLESFCNAFTLPGLALFLFTAFEHGRVRVRLAARYPGLWKASLPLQRSEMKGIIENAGPLAGLARLYARAALEMETEEGSDPAQKSLDAFSRLADTSEHPEASASAAAAAYADWEEALGADAEVFAQLLPERSFSLLPLGRAVSPALLSARDFAHRARAEKLVRALRKSGIQVFLSDMAEMMERSDGKLAPQDVREAQEKAADFLGEPDASPPSGDISEILAQQQALAPEGEASSAEGAVFWYREYSKDVADFLPAHCRLMEVPAPRGAESFYESVLEDFPGLVSSIRKSFEILRPEGIKRLRRHVEGDDFDHRALIDLAVDLRSGRSPSERIYTKRVKQVRDVSAMLLVDLSRSTSNLVPGTDRSVLTVEQQAMVLFCEALETVGDAFCVAGFSGAGRLRVDFVTVKDFAEPLGPEVKGRIGALTPLRNTRMGAALRHAASIMEKAPGRVKVLIVLSDGFPNDLDYKADYAVEDTRKALAEVRAKNVHVHAITVNLSDAARIDEIYRDVHRTIITDAAELPEKLPRIYRAITR